MIKLLKVEFCLFKLFYSLCQMPLSMLSLHRIWVSVINIFLLLNITIDGITNLSLHCSSSFPWSWWHYSVVQNKLDTFVCKSHISHNWVNIYLVYLKIFTKWWYLGRMYWKCHQNVCWNNEMGVLFWWKVNKNNKKTKQQQHVPRT